MRINIHDAITLEDPADFRSFSVRSCLGADEMAGRLRVARMGYLRDSYAYVNIRWLRAEVSRSGVDPTGAQLDKMITFAVSRGWVDDDRTHVRAHIDAA